MTALDRRPIFKKVGEWVTWTPERIRELDAVLTDLGFPPVEESAFPAAAAQPRRPTGLTNPKAFYDAVRASLFGGSLSPEQVLGMEAKVKAFGDAGWPIAFAAKAMATSYWETGRKMVPVSEKGSGRDADGDGLDDYLERYDTGPLATRLGNTPENDGDGVRMAGKGDVQLTGASNYRWATAELRKRGIIGPDEDLHRTPDLALRPDISACVMVFGMEEGWFTGKKLSDYLPRTGAATVDQFAAARRIINGQDKARTIAEIAIKFQDALQKGGWA